MVDWLPFFYGVGVLTMRLNGRSKRLGDFASGTLVVLEGSHKTFAVGPGLAADALNADEEAPPVTLVERRCMLVRLPGSPPEHAPDRPLRAAQR